MTHPPKKQKMESNNTSIYTNSPYSNNTSTASAAKSFDSSANRVSALNDDKISSTNFGRNTKNIAEEASSADTEMTSAPGCDESAQPRQPPQEPFTDQNLQETIRMHQVRHLAPIRICRPGQLTPHRHFSPMMRKTLFPRQRQQPLGQRRQSHREK